VTITSNRGPNGLFWRDLNLQALFELEYWRIKWNWIAVRKNRYQSSERKSGTSAAALKREVPLLLNKNRTECGCDKREDPNDIVQRSDTKGKKKKKKKIED